MKEVTTKQFASNSIWKFLELFSKKIIALVLSTILARLLSPDVYGVVALTTVFITFSDIFITNGFNIALIRKEHASDIDYSTVMSLGLLFSVLLYAVFFLLAPILASFYDTPAFSPVLRVLTLLIFLKSISSVIKARATRELQFKKMSFISVITSTMASLIGIALAYKGYGVWALVMQQILANLFDVLALSIVFKWKYSFRISKEAAQEMTRFTFGVLGTSFLDFLGNNLNSLVIGKAYNATELGYYNRGNMYPETISLNMYNSINSVLLPTLASRQNNKESMRRVVSKVLSVTSYIIFPLMFGLISVSDFFVKVVLTDKWVPCIPILICAALVYAINPIRAIGYSVFYAKGESQKCVRIEIIRSVIMISNLVITIILLKKSVYVLAFVNVVVALLVAMATQIMVNKSIDYSLKLFLTDLLPAFVMSLIMLAFVRIVGLLPIKSGVVLILQIIVGGTVYLLMSIVSKNESFNFLKSYVFKIFKK